MKAIALRRVCDVLIGDTILLEDGEVKIISRNIVNGNFILSISEDVCRICKVDYLDHGEVADQHLIAPTISTLTFLSHDYVVVHVVNRVIS